MTLRVLPGGGAGESDAPESGGYRLRLSISDVLLTTEPGEDVAEVVQDAVRLAPKADLHRVEIFNSSRQPLAVLDLGATQTIFTSIWGRADEPLMAALRPYMKTTKPASSPANHLPALI